MLHSHLLFCILYTPVASVMLSPVLEDHAATQALQFAGRGSWNQSSSFANGTDPTISPLSSPSLNNTGENLINNLSTSLEQVLWPSPDTYNNFTYQCLLWDNQCSGNRTQALDLFFNNSGALYNLVYGAHCIWSREPECAPWLPSPAEVPRLLDWLRQPECVQSFYEYHTQHAGQLPWTWSRRMFDGWSTHAIDWNTISTTTSTVGCCGQCTVYGGNVDVYYWPVLGAKTNCISTIGSKFNDPAELMITDDRGYPYWKAQTNPWGQNGSQITDSIAIPPEQALAGGMVNPLSAPPSIIQARGYWRINTTLAANVSNSEAIATIGGFRCTSPSICVGFSDIYAADGCGALSTDGEVVSYTIIAFAPEELSTIQIPAWVRSNVPPKAAIRSFNFGDLPCPPQSVMYAVEYKPAHGEPYRPVLSAPSRLSSLLPEWSKSGCIIPAALFNGVDLPKALKPAEILTPRVTQVLLSATAAAVAAPASGIRADEPSKTPNPSSKESSSPSDPETRESGSEVGDPSSSDPDHADPENTDPETSDSEESDTSITNSINADPQSIRVSTSKQETVAGDASRPKPIYSETLDGKHANPRPPSSQNINSQVLDGPNNPQELQGSSPEISKEDDPQVDTSSSDHFQPNVPDDPSEMVGSSKDVSNHIPSNDDTSYPSNSNRKDVPSSKLPEGEAADSNTGNPKPFNSHSKVANPEGKETAILHPNTSPAAGFKAKGGEIPDAKGSDVELNPFDFLLSKLLDNNEALSTTAKADGQHSIPNNPGREVSSQLEKLEPSQSGNSRSAGEATANSAQSGDSRNDDEATANGAQSEDGQNDDEATANSAQSRDSRNVAEATANSALQSQDLAKTLVASNSDAIADLPSMTAPADGSTISAQFSTHELPTASSNAIEDLTSRTAPPSDTTSANVAVGFPKESASTPSPAVISASGLSLGSGALNGGKAPDETINAAASRKAPSSSSASRRRPENGAWKSVRGLLFSACIYVLPRALMLLLL